jgi:glycolate oxidase FAD binding subunit
VTVAAAADPVAGLRDVLPRELVLEGDAVRPWNVWGQPPRAVAFPRSTEEAASVLARASEEGWTVEPAGSGTWLWAGNAAPPPDLVLSSARMDRVVEHEPGDLVITVEAGMRMSALDALLAPHNQWLPLDPPGQKRTLGAVASTGVWGPLGAAWGGPRDLAIGMRAVTGDGRAFRAGGRVVKNVAGFDLVRLLAGSRGTLAFITEVTLRLFPRPAVDRTLVVRGERLDDLVAGAIAASSRAVTPAAVELLERFMPLEGRREAVLAVRVLGLGERVRAEEDVIRAALASAGVGPVEELPPAEADALWREIRLLEEGADLALRFATKPERIADLAELARTVGRMRNGKDELGRSPVRLAMHGGAGALRLAAPNLRLDSGWAERWAERLDDLRRTIGWRGGTLTVTRAPAAVVEQLGAWERPGPAVELMAGLKRVFDPAGILSPDRFVLDLAPRDARVRQEI